MENIWMLLQQTAAGGLCALFLLLLQRIFRNLLSPRWQYGIWGVLVLRLLIPVGAWGRSTVLDVWPWLEAARAGAELTLDSAYSSLPRLADGLFLAAFSAGRSTMVFHAPQAGHFPCHFGVSFPHSVQ